AGTYVYTSSNGFNFDGDFNVSGGTFSSNNVVQSMNCGDIIAAASTLSMLNGTVQFYRGGTCAGTTTLDLNGNTVGTFSLADIVATVNVASDFNTTTIHIGSGSNVTLNGQDINISGSTT